MNSGVKVPPVKPIHLYTKLKNKQRTEEETVDLHPSSPTPLLHRYFPSFCFHVTYILLLSLFLPPIPLETSSFLLKVSEKGCFLVQFLQLPSHRVAVRVQTTSFQPKTFTLPEFREIPHKIIHLAILDVMTWHNLRVWVSGKYSLCWWYTLKGERYTHTHTHVCIKKPNN